LTVEKRVEIANKQRAATPQIVGGIFARSFTGKREVDMLVAFALCRGPQNNLKKSQKISKISKNIKKISKKYQTNIKHCPVYSVRLRQ